MTEIPRVLSKSCSGLWSCGPNLSQNICDRRDFFVGCVGAARYRPRRGKPVQFLDFPSTPGYPSRFLSGASRTGWKCRGCSSVGRALEWHSRGQGFDSPHLHWAGSRRRRCVVRAGMKSAGIAQLVEHNLAKVGVAGSSPVSRLFFARILGG